jgi:hypothetical protein
MKKIILILSLILFYCSCSKSNLKFELIVERNYEIDIENVIEDKVKEKYNSQKIILKCKVNNCKIYENNILVLDKILNEKEINRIKKLINGIKEKSKEKNPLLVTNTNSKLIFNKKNYEIPYITNDQEEIFNILLYKNKKLISDEKYNESNKFYYAYFNGTVGTWRIICELKLCKVFYNSSKRYLLNQKEWEIELTKEERMEIEKKLINTAKKRHKIDVMTRTNYSLSFDNGKEYHYTISDGKFEKILDELIGTDHKLVEKEYLEY